MHPHTTLPLLLLTPLLLLAACGAGSGKAAEPPRDTSQAPQPIAGKGAEPMTRQAIRLSKLSVLGAPLGIELPAPVDTFAAWTLDPDWVYSLDLSPTVVCEDCTWEFELRGALGSTIIMESYPPQLGNPSATVTSDYGSLGFKVTPGWTLLVAVDVKLRQGETVKAAKQYLARTTEFDPSRTEMVPGEILIGLAEGLKALDPAVIAFLGRMKLETKQELLDGTVILVHDPDQPEEDPLALHARVIGDPVVAYAEPNYIARTQAGVVEE